VPEDFHAELVPVEDEVGPFGGKSVSEIALNGAARRSPSPSTTPSAPGSGMAVHAGTGVEGDGEAVSETTYECTCYRKTIHVGGFE
jgi:hypothetical protein